MGTKLSVRDIPNNKVTYKSSTQRAVNYEGTPLTANNFFSGFTMNPQVFAADDGLLSFGDNVREALLSHLGHIGAIGPQISDLESQQKLAYGKQDAVLNPSFIAISPYINSAEILKLVEEFNKTLL